MDSKSDIIDYLWQIGFFKKSRTHKEIQEKVQEDFEIYCPNLIPILKLKRFSKKLKKFKEGWKEIFPANPKNIKKEGNFEEIKKILGDAFKKELEELDIVSNKCPNCTSFLLRKILEKLLFIIISKSNRKQKITIIKQKENRLPNLTELLNIAQISEIKNMHIITPKNIKKLNGSKFLGDTSAHDYLISVSFEDIKQEISIWRISIKELASNL